MKQLTPIALILSASFALSPVSSGQSKQRPAEKRPITVVVHTPPEAYRKAGRAEISYFAEQDSTEVRAELDTVYRKGRDWANMYALYNVRGREVVRPDEVTLGILYYADEATVKAADSFSVEVDGETIAPARLELGKVFYGVDEKRHGKDLTGMVPFTQFERIANGKSVKVNMGAVSFTLDGKSRAALLDMVKAIGGATKRP